MKINKEYMCLCRAIQMKNKFLADNMFWRVGSRVFEDTKHAIWFTNFLDRNGAIIKRR
ncbi:MAG: hypothetical protein J6S85_05770 [Methanobrevibacter sp.]|nr:hypothetical protein [Methanobrevibacter sp.]